MSSGNRPLSPHLQVYKMPMSAKMSITHRITGIILSGGALLLAYWVSAAAHGPEAFETAQAIAGSFIGRFIMFGFTLCLCYHLCHGIRHIIWDTGAKALDLETVNKSGKIALLATVALTVLVWVVAYVVGG